MQNQFTFSTAMTASQADLNPISSWAGRFPQARALVTVLFRATTAGVRLVLSSGTRAIQPRSPVQSGGTAGVTPSTLNTNPIQYIAEPGEEIMPLLTEVLAGTPTVDGTVSWEEV